MTGTCNPCDIEGIRRRLAARLGRRAADAIRTREIVIDQDVLGQMPTWLTRHVKSQTNVVLVWDDRPMQRGRASLKTLIHQAAINTGMPVRVVELSRHLHATEAAAQMVQDQLNNGSVIVGVGSGNLSDTCKHARAQYAQRTGKRPTLICWPTANSVNAYSSSLAILVVNGVKRSLPSWPPDVILCDLATLVSAPRAMQQAGLGDMLARCVAHGDWYLAHRLGMDSSYTQVVYELLGDTEDRVLGSAEQIGRQTIEGTRILTEALMLTGLVMSAVHQSAPLSGWEHVISHYLDLVAMAEGRPLALHGAQVGVGSVIASRGYEMLIHRAFPKMLSLNHGLPDAQTIKSQIDDHFGSIDSDGSRRLELWRDCERKIAQWHDQRQHWQSFCADWRVGKIQAELARLVRSPQVVSDALAVAGAPILFDQLDPPVNARQARSAIEHAHLVRHRFTLGDLLSVCGLTGSVCERVGV